jgi:alkyl hydroperoxide reductase subunit D
MELSILKESISDNLKDVRLNFAVLTEESELSRTQLAIINLACAYSLQHAELLAALKTEFSAEVSEELNNAAQAAAAIMAMNNIYYRFVHLTTDKVYQTMPAKLRMNVIGKPGVDKVDFELASLAVSALNGCGMCIDAHAKVLENADVSKLMIQHAVRIAAVQNSIIVALQLSNLSE